MNIEKAIDILNDTEADMNYTKNEISLAHLMGIIALRKKIPKYAKGKGSTKEVGYCPSCKSHLMYEPKTNYCRWCGQRLSWEVRNEQ